MRSKVCQRRLRWITGQGRKKKKKKNSRLVDDHHHPIPAVLPLGAVDPERVGAVDPDGVGRDHAHGGAGRGRQVARVEARDVGVHRDGLTRLVEGGLCDGVVAGVELELHVLAGLRGQLLWRVGQAAILRDGDDPGSLRCGSVSSSSLHRVRMIRRPGQGTYRTPGSRERRGRAS